MTEIGYARSSEEHPGSALVANARAAEEGGFSFIGISDHYHPWLTSQGHSPFVWSVLGGIAATTTRVRVGVGVSCPLMRIHPAVVAQATATTAEMLGDRFFWGVGTGENLNEHITGDRWPPIEVRLAMLEEAVEVIRRLWTGESVDHWGTHYTVENARIHTRPAQPPPIIVSGFGERSIELAGRIGDGFWSNKPSPEPIEAYEKAGGTGPRYGQLTICWAADEASARRTAHERWANAGVPGLLSQDLPTTLHFEQAAQAVTEDKVAESVPCGPDPGPVVDKLRTYADAGYTNVYLHQIGPDQQGFFGFWERELRPALTAVPGLIAAQ